MKKVSETLVFKVNGNNGYAQTLGEKIDSLPNAEEFRDAYIIAVENKENGKQFQDCYGIILALNILKENPTAKIVLFAFLTEEYIRTKVPQIDLVLKYENTRFIKGAISEEMLKNMFRKKEVTQTLFTAVDEVEQNMREILHALPRDLENISVSQNHAIQRGISLGKKFFPALKNESDDYVLHFIKKVATSREEVAKGKEFSGVYCDVEGTILVLGIPNNPVMDFLQKMKTEGNRVTLWTDGNPKAIRMMLHDFGISYPLHKKSDYAGGLVEIAIDDMDEYSFSALTKISAKKFIRVSDIQ